MMNFFSEHFCELLYKISQQLYLVGLSLSFATFFGVSLALSTMRYPKIQTSIINIATIFQTIPSLALLALLLPFLGIGAKPAIVALSLYALLPIIQNTVIGFQTIPAHYLETADALGMSSWQKIKWVEFPFAFPTLLTGIRTATTISVGITTLAAFIGAGGLGDFINRGLALNNTNYLLLGAVPAAILAIWLDILLRHIQCYFDKPSKIKNKWISCILFFSSFAAFTMMMILPYWQGLTPKQTIRIGSKNFTEQLILGEIMAQLIETKTTLKVERFFNLGTTEIVHHALEKGEIDIYPEYTGTAYLTLYHLRFNPDQVNNIYSIVHNKEHELFHIQWLKPFGFNNSQALALRNIDAQHWKLIKISDLKPKAPLLTLGAPTEFIQREDGLPGLEKVYQLHFKNIIELAPSLVYQALDRQEVNIILVFSTDGEIPGYHLKLLDDDRHLFPRYDAAPLIREEILKKHPELKNLLEQLAYKINENTMQKMNELVNVEKKSVQEVAHQFLISKKLI